MAWIKRNLFFAIGLIVALLLLAAAVVYDLQSMADNSTEKSKLNEIYDTLKQINGGSKFTWGNAKINNIQTARDQTAEILNWQNKIGGYFTPIVRIPNMPNVNSEAFANALRRTIDQLQHEAADAGVELPPKYAFSFEAQRSSVRYAPGSLPLLSVQLGEVKTISEILFAARMNALDSVQRVHLSDDDTAGPQADYINDIPTTNSLAILTPYAVTFRCFSGELAAVLAGFAASPHAFIVTGITVAPVGGGQPVQTGASLGGNVRPNSGMPLATPLPTSAAVTSRGGLPTVLNEQLLRVTLQIEIVKLLPGR